MGQQRGGRVGGIRLLLLPLTKGKVVSLWDHYPFTMP